MVRGQRESCDVMTCAWITVDTKHVLDQKTVTVGPVKIHVHVPYVKYAKKHQAVGRAATERKLIARDFEGSGSFLLQ